MCRRLILSISVVLVLALVNGASADTFNWTNNDPLNSSWCDGDNWNPEQVPAYDDDVIIGPMSPERGPIIGSDICGDVTVGVIHGPAWSVSTDQVMDINTSGTVTIGGWARDEEGTGTCTINVNGTPTITIGGDYWCLPDQAVGIINISGDPCIIVAGDLRGADYAGSLYINMSGGRVEVGDSMSWGDNGGGELNLSGGDITIGGNLALGSLRGSELITLNITGGSISIAGAFECPSNKDRAGSVTVNLDAGVIACNEFVHGSIIEGEPSYTDDWHVDIEEGVLKIRGDVTAAIDANVAAGQITAYEGDGTVVVEFTDGNTVVTARPPDPNFACFPFPSNLSENVDPDVILSWTSGVNAVWHDVYFGTDFNDVNDAGTTSDVYEGRQGEVQNTFDPNGLELLTTYYWRVDEINGGTWKGKVWSFTVRSAIIDPNMVLWYKLDESNGVIACDSSGYGNHGPIGLDDEKEVQAPTWDADGHDGGCLIFADDTVVQPPATLLGNIGGQITFSVWLKDPSLGEDNWVFDAGGGEGAARHLCAAFPDSSGNAYWRAGDDTNDVCVWSGADPAEWQGFWRHFVFVKDENAGKMKIYYDGKPVAEKTGVSVGTLAGVRDRALKVGTEAWDNFDYEGAMDDFRMFDKALNASEVAALFRGGDVGLAWAPDPSNGQKDVGRDAILTWKPGDYAAEHDVYLGTNWDDVNDAVTVSAAYRGTYGPNEYNPGALELETTYYWRIDEVNGPNTWKGDVWRFTAANFLIVDDMESYIATTGSGNEIFDTWDDGFVNGTGSQVQLEYASAIIHGGKQAMKLGYNNAIGLYKYSEVDANTAGSRPGNLAIGPNWTQLGVKALTLFFYGAAGNDVTEQMYVALEDGSENIHIARYGDMGEDMNDITQEQWHQWDIPLSGFSDNGVTIADINKVRIGFGDRVSPVPGGTGVVYFDDIRLYLPKCVPWLARPAADFSNNCIVDFADVAIMAGQWLRTEANLAVEPPGADPVGWWPLDEGTGVQVSDASGNDNHGTLEGDYSWIAGRIGAYALELSSGRVLVPDDGNAPELRPADQISVCAWVNFYLDQGYSSRVVVKGYDAGDQENFALQIEDLDGGGFFIRDSNTVLRGVSFGQGFWPREWIHLAATYDGNAVHAYVNGQLSDKETIGEVVLLQNAGPLAIGDAVDVVRSYRGKVDDIRIYDYALSEPRVAHIATETTGYMPLTSGANLYDAEPQYEKAINFRDYAVLMETWLEQKLWPPE